jgi:hypothetical protein
MTGNQYTVILVYATSHALRAEKVLQGDGISCKLIPVPRHLSSDCGVCIRVERSSQAAARQALEAAGVETVGVHEI